MDVSSGEINRKELRKQVIARRAAMDPALRQEKSEQICQKLGEMLAELTKDSALKPEESAIPALRPEGLDIPSPQKTDGASIPAPQKADGTGVPAPLVGVYSAFPEEVQLDSFIRQAYEQGARVAFPCMIKDAWGTEGAATQTMEMREVSAADYCANTVEFLLRPLRSYHHADEAIAAYPYVEASELSLLVCPLVAFDAHNNRLGYGGGNYDRYLTQLSQTTVIGVAFKEQQCDAVPVEEHDIALPILSV
ncbi:MAG: 5-formyltetrahydrofolate cyclo-ligase [Anaerotardibacter sp.]